jgi:D-alanyl-D-alanine dipeptidase
LRLPFRGYVEAFIDALRTAGATVNINATYRPPKRAYLMHWSWKIAKNRVSPKDVPAMDGVAISWEHYDRDGEYSDTESVAAAREMVRGFEMQRLGVAPSLKSRHTAGCGIDMTISWTGDLRIRDAEGALVVIDRTPRTGMNPQLHRVGESYGVIKYNRSGRDDPHWSDTGA